MIVTIRGTCGSGKSTVIHDYMRDKLKMAVWSNGRRRPIGYMMNTGIFIVGHYEIPMGGIDTFKTYEEALKVIKHYAGKGKRILFEGKVQNYDVPHLLRLNKKWPLTVIHLTVTQDEAIQGVRQRPSATEIQEELIRRVHRKCERDANLLVNAGIKVIRTNRNNALKAVELALGEQT